jgi:hypothetical protein
MTPEEFGTAFVQSVGTLSLGSVAGAVAGGLVYHAAKRIVSDGSAPTEILLQFNGRAVIPAAIIGVGVFLVTQAVVTHEQTKKKD